MTDWLVEHKVRTGTKGVSVCYYSNQYPYTAKTVGTFVPSSSPVLGILQCSNSQDNESKRNAIGCAVTNVGAFVATTVLQCWRITPNTHTPIIPQWWHQYRGDATKTRVLPFPVICDKEWDPAQPWSGTWREISSSYQHRNNKMFIIDIWKIRRSLIKSKVRLHTANNSTSPYVFTQPNFTPAFMLPSAPRHYLYEFVTWSVKIPF